MAEEHSPSDVARDIFAEHAEWLAAQARQLFRANRAHDAKASEVTLLYFFDYVLKVLGRHLSMYDPAWNSSSRPLDFSSHRWLDGLSAEPEYPAPGCVRLRGTVSWVVGQEQWHYDPFDFQLELSPKTGAFKQYVFRFGDSRPLSAKIEGCATPGLPVGGWAYEFERRKAEPGSTADRRRN